MNNMDDSGSFNPVDYMTECSRIAQIDSAAARDIEIKKLIKALNHAVGIDPIRKDIDRIRMEMKAAAEQAAKNARKAVANDDEALLAEMNDEFAMISLGGETSIMRETVDVNGRPTTEFMTAKSFTEWTSGMSKVPGLTAGGKAKETLAANWWMEHPDRRTYNGIVFKPGCDRDVHVPGSNTPFFNVWKGWGVEPTRSGSCKIFKRHLWENVCNRNKNAFKWIWRFMAHIFQRPMEKPSVAAALVGPKGVGKTIVGDTLGVLVGPNHHVVMTHDLLTGRFNGHMRTALILQADEAFFAGDPRVADLLNREISAKRRSIEDKGRKVIGSCEAYDRFLFTSEHESAIPVGKKERRYSIFNVGVGHAQDTPYFKALLQELEAGGYGRLLYELMETDISTFNPHEHHGTEALKQQRAATLPPDERFLVDLAMSLELWEDGGGIRLDQTIPKQQLYNIYDEHLRRQRSRATETALGIMLRRFGFLSTRMTLKNAMFVAGAMKMEGMQVQAFKLPNPIILRQTLTVEFELPETFFNSGEPIVVAPEPAF